MEKQIREIRYPNTVKPEDQGFFLKDDGYEIIRKTKNGEMALVGWFSIYQGADKVAEIKESICDIYY